MELELGLKITQKRDDVSSTTNFRMAKDASGPIFMSRETESKFILVANLKGIGKEHIGIKITEDGTQIIITLEKSVQETVMSRWMMHKKEVELKGFIRAFRIPSGVVLDRIKAKFNEQESVLTILMPKSTKGIQGVGIEEVKEEKIVNRGVGKAAGDISPVMQHFELESSDSSKHDRIIEKSETMNRLEKVEEELLEGIEAMLGSIKNESDCLPEQVLQERLKDNAAHEENRSRKIEKEVEETAKVVEENEDQDKETNVDESSQKEQTPEEKQKKPHSRKMNLRKPCVIVGSSIFVSLIVIAIRWIRSRKRQAQ